jgi:hypothetical protein
MVANFHKCVAKHCERNTLVVKTGNHANVKVPCASFMATASAVSKRVLHNIVSPYSALDLCVQLQRTSDGAARLGGRSREGREVGEPEPRLHRPMWSSVHRSGPLPRGGSVNVIRDQNQL